jgi:hypothetical protein
MESCGHYHIKTSEPGRHEKLLNSQFAEVSISGASSVGFQPAIPLGSAKDGKMPALRMASRRLFISPLTVFGFVRRDLFS